MISIFDRNNFYIYFRKEEFVTVVFFKQNSIEFVGHAKQSEVCHGISAVGNMVANYLEDHQQCKVVRKDGHMLIYDINDTDLMDNPLIEALKTALKDIQTEYPDNLEIKYV